MPRSSCGPRSTDEVAAVVRGLPPRHHLPLTVAGGRSGVTGASVPVFGGVRARHHRRWPASSPSTTTSGVVEVLAGTFGPDLERRAAARARPQRRPLPAELRHRDRRRLGRLPRRRPVLDALRQDRGHRRRARGRARRRHGRAHRRRAGGRRRARPHPAVHRVRGHARRHHPGVAAGPPGAAGGPPGGFWFDTFAAGIEACRRILRRGATPAVLRLYDAVESARGHGGDGTRCVLLVLDEGDPLIVDATMAVVAECMLRRPAASPATRPLVDAWLEHRNDTSALQALTRKGFVVDTMEIAAPVGRARRRCSTSVARRSLAVAARPRRQLPPLAQLSRRRVPLLHVRRHAAARRGRVDLHRAVGRRPARRARRRRQPVAPPRRRHQPGPLHGRRPRRPAFGVLAAVKAALDPQRHPQPGQARPARRRSATRRGRLDDAPRQRTRWDWDAIRAGAAVALVFAVPFSIAARWAADSRDDSGAGRVARPRRASSASSSAPAARHGSSASGRRSATAW